MDEEKIASWKKYLCWAIGSVVGFVIWFVMLVIVDDFGMWHFEFAGFLSEMLRFGLIILTGLVAAGIGFLINLFLATLFKNDNI